MRIVRACCVISTALMLFGCASAPSQEALSGADYGNPITQEEALGVLKSYYSTRAKDPESLRVNCGPVYQGWVSNRFSSKSLLAGYLLDCSINGKNSFGAYVGARNYRFVIRNGTIVKVLEQMSNGNYGPEGIVDALRNMN